MKKVIAILIAVMCIFGTFSVSADTKTAVAEEIDSFVSIEFSSNFSELTYNGESYVQFNNNLLTGEIDTLSSEVKLTPNQQQILTSMYVDISDQNDIIYANYVLKNGGQMNFTYLKREYIELYNDVMANNWDTAKIDFIWPEDNIITVNKQLLKQTKTTMFVTEFTDVFDVYAPIGDKNFGIMKGMLCNNGDKYYYVDYVDAQIVYDKDFDIWDYSNVIAYEITDEVLYNQIETAIQKNYGVDYGFFEDDKFTAKVSDVFLIIAFAVIPLGIFVVFLILTLRSKTGYKKFFGTITILSAVELIIFIGLTVLFEVFRI